MTIGSVGAVTHFRPTPQIVPAEARETGPDTDNDGDEGASGVAKAMLGATLPAPTGGRGVSVDISA